MELVNKLVKRITYPFKLRAMRKAMHKWVELDKQNELTRQAKLKERKFGFGVPDMSGLALFFAIQSNKPLRTEVMEVAQAWGVEIGDLPKSWLNSKLKEHSTNHETLKARTLKNRTTTMPDAMEARAIQLSKDSTVQDIINKSRTESLKEALSQSDGHVYFSKPELTHASKEIEGVSTQRVLDEARKQVQEYFTSFNGKPVRVEISSPLISDEQVLAIQLAQFGDPKELNEKLFQNIKD